MITDKIKKIDFESGHADASLQKSDFSLTLPLGWARQNLHVDDNVVILHEKCGIEFAVVCNGRLFIDVNPMDTRKFIKMLPFRDKMLFKRAMVHERLCRKELPALIACKNFDKLVSYRRNLDFCISYTK